VSLAITEIFQNLCLSGSSIRRLGIVEDKQILLKQFCLLLYIEAIAPQELILENLTSPLARLVRKISSSAKSESCLNKILTAEKTFGFRGLKNSKVF